MMIVCAGTDETQAMTCHIENGLAGCTALQAATPPKVKDWRREYIVQVRERAKNPQESVRER